jgi:hypothetical protein
MEQPLTKEEFVAKMKEDKRKKRYAEAQLNYDLKTIYVNRKKRCGVKNWYK